MNEEIKVRWLGTAGFEISLRYPILIDPFLRRNRKASPVQNLKPEDFSHAQYIFVSHGHSDHAIDVPDIARFSQSKIFCSSVTRRFLIRKKVNPHLITVIDGDREFDFGDFSVKAYLCKHSKIDVGIIIESMPQLLIAVPRLLADFLTMPGGPLVVLLFDFSGLKILHMGSLPADHRKIASKLSDKTDVALVPLRGRSDIAEIAAEFSKSLKPRAIVIHHHDNFAPPLSPPVDVKTFEERIEKLMPGTMLYEPEMNVYFSPKKLIEPL